MRCACIGLMLAASLSGALVGISAARADEYTTRESYSVAWPKPTNSYTTVASAFGASTTADVDGFPLRGRILAATDSSVFLQKNFGAGHWLTVGTVRETMDPSFIEITPDGTKIALGTGFFQPLYVFPTASLSAAAPPVLSHALGTKTFELSYYDAAWRDSRFLFINAGTHTGSAVFAVDTASETPESAIVPVIDAIPGASAGVTFDRHGNLITGIGYGSDTGQLKIWPASDVAGALEPGAAALDYTNTGHILAEGILSAASLGVSTENDLHVGGGDVFGGSGDIGYAALISASVLTRVLAGGPPVDRASAEDFRRVAPDPCANDDATSVLFVPGVEMLSVSFNAGSLPPGCEAVDWSGADSPSRVQLFFPESAPDTDGDGVPDGADNAFRVPNPDQLDSDEDGFGDVADCDADGDGFVGRAELAKLVNAFGKHAGTSDFAAELDSDRSGTLDLTDFSALERRWGRAALCE